jgi:hypothetical protein
MNNQISRFIVMTSLLYCLVVLLVLYNELNLKAMKLIDPGKFDQSFLNMLALILRMRFLELGQVSLS